MKVVYSYKHVPTIKAFSFSDAFLRALIGPVGGGKTVGCFVEIIHRGMKQEPDPDGVRRTRWAAVRNTFKELEDTTMKTCMEWLPATTFGNLVSSKHQYMINQLETSDGTPVEIEILFRALDRPDQLRDLLSLELTGCYFNEMREIAKPIFDIMTTRVNRYPSRKNEGPGATWSGVFGDSNPCDTDHWMYVLFEDEKPVCCSACKTPTGGIVEYPTRRHDKSIIPLHERRCPQCNGDIAKAMHLTQIFRQPSARSPMAENLPNLAPDYYGKLMVGKTPEFLRVYVDGEYGFMVDGRAVYSTWSQQMHVTERDIEPIRGIPLVIGIDYGRNPAIVICQPTPLGHFNVLDEICAENIDIRQFTTTFFKPYLITHYFGLEVCIAGDPSGISRSQTDSNTCFRELASHGLRAIPAPTNSLQARLAAVNTLLMRPVPSKAAKEGDPLWKPALQVSPRCKSLIRGFNGGYRMRRLHIHNQERYKDEPEKTKESHCFVAGTQIATEFGNKPIESVQVGEKVITPFGLSRVLKAWKTRENANTIQITLSDGTKLEGTPDHPFYTRDKRLLRMDALQYNDILECIDLQGGMKWIIHYMLSLMAKNIGFLPGTITGRKIGARAAHLIYTGLYGSIVLAEKFLADIIFTTRTTIASIMNFPTLSLRPAENMAQGTQNEIIKPIQIVGKALRPPKKPLNNGMVRRMEESGIGNMQKLSGSIKNHLRSFAKFVVHPGQRRSHLERIGVAQNVNLRPAECEEMITLKGFVKFVGALLRQTNILRPKHAPRVVRVNYKQEPKPVYNLTIENHHIYFANGILVQNCHDALQYAALLYESGAVRVRTSVRGGIRGENVSAPPLGAYT